MSLDKAMEQTKVKSRKSRANPEGKDLLGHQLCVLDEQGFEHLDTTPVEMPEQGFEPTSSADEKLIIMINAMQEKIQRLSQGKPAEDYETVEDSHDFEVPQHGFNNPFTYDPDTKQYIRKAKNEFQLRKKQKSSKTNSTDDEVPVGSKSAKSDRAERVELDKGKQQSASKAPTEGADE